MMEPSLLVMLKCIRCIKQKVLTRFMKFTTLLGNNVPAECKFLEAKNLMMAKSSNTWVDCKGARNVMS